jgi:hydroxymethylbilane synthase
MSLIRIATRNSPLALWQANFVKDQLLQTHKNLKVEIVGMTTKGDQLLDRSLAAVGGKGLFLKELEVSLLNGETDIAVHSMKDVPVTLPDGLEIAVVCEREDPRDAFVSNDFQNLYALSPGARVGTASLRRVAQLKHAFPNLEFVELRGNVNTRLAKLDGGEYDAIILAAAGLIRLGFEQRIKQFIAPELCLPAVGQGVVGIECRSDDQATQALLQALHSHESSLLLTAERAMNQELEGGCQVPVAGFAELVKGKISMRGLVGAVDGSKVLRCSMTGTDRSLSSAADLGQNVAKDLLKQGAAKILASVYAAADDGSPKAKDSLQGSTSTSAKPTVLLTRQKRYLGNMMPILERLDYQPLHLPVIDVERSLSDESAERIKKIANYTDVVFVSRNAVEMGMFLIDELADWPEGIRALAVGAETAKQLYRFGVDAMFPDQGSGALALLAVSQLADLSDRKILIIRGEVGLDWPEDEMRKRGALVDRAVVYSQRAPLQSRQALQALLEHHQSFAGVFAHSVQSVRNLIEIAGDESNNLLSSKLVAGSQRIADTALQLGWLGEVRVADSPSNKHMMITFSG